MFRELPHLPEPLYLGALAAVIAFLIQIPYPVPGFTFLQIDLAEIVDVLAFLLFGPAVGLLTTLIHYLVLNFLPTASPIFGPLLKLFGVTSMLLGMCWDTEFTLGS